MGIDALDIVGHSASDKLYTQGSNAGDTTNVDNVGITRQISKVCNLPVEMWQKIAFNLDYDSYNALRCVSKQTHDIIPISTLYNRISDENATLTDASRQDYMKCLSQNSLLTFVTSFSPLSQYLISQININCLNLSRQADEFVFKINLLSEISDNKDDIKMTSLIDQLRYPLFASVPDTIFALESTITFSKACLAHFKQKNDHGSESEKNKALHSDALVFYCRLSAFYPDLSGVSSEMASGDSDAVKPHIEAVFDCLQKYTEALNHREQVVMHVIGHKLYHFCLENSEEGPPRNSMILALKPFSAFLSECAEVDRMVNYVLDSPAQE